LSNPIAFISYSHDSEEHKKWVLDLALRLCNKGVNVILDQWGLRPGDDLPQFMERGLASADRVLMVCTEKYVEKANSGTGGVGYGKMIVTADLLKTIDSNKAIPLIRQSGGLALPTFLRSKIYLNFSRQDVFESSFDELVRTLYNRPLFEKPPLGNSPFALTSKIENLKNNGITISAEHDILPRERTRAFERELKAIDSKKKEAFARDEHLVNKVNENYIALDHGIPYYKHRNITARPTGNKLVARVPEEFHSRLNEDGHVFDIREETLSSWNEKIEKSFKHFQIENHEEHILQAANQEAMMFLDDIRKGYHRFNSELFGVERIRPSRIGENEEASLKIDFYSTDYFTHRVFGNIYRKLLENHKIDKNLKIPELNEFFSPFLSSFGIGCFIILDRGKGDEILLAHRSTSVMVDKGKLHYSMNEAFSINDTESIDKFPSLKECLFRGFREELGINSKFAHNIDDFGFLDLGIITDRCEIGISAFARIKWDEHFQFKHLGVLYSIGQDAELETDKLELVEMTALEEFISSNYTKLSDGCRSTLRLLLARYEAGYLQ
jgi:hypothetical protein